MGDSNPIPTPEVTALRASSGGGAGLSRRIFLGTLGTFGTNYLATCGASRCRLIPG